MAPRKPPQPAIVRLLTVEKTTRLTISRQKVEDILREHLKLPAGAEINFVCHDTGDYGVLDEVTITTVERTEEENPFHE